MLFWPLYMMHWFRTLPFLTGWFLDRLLGDPEGWTHPVIWFGKWIAAGERKLNNSANRFMKGTFLAILLTGGTFTGCYLLLLIARNIHPLLADVLITIGVFYCLAGKTLIKEVKNVFEAVERNLEDGRKQVGRIVGRDTSELSEHEIKTAALETLSENLSDGVIAPMFWFALLGLPGMMTYKMVNTLDSMIGYRNERYKDFGCAAAKIDDMANYLPARITAYLMLAVSGNWNKRMFLAEFGNVHASPNAGYPEAALAAILDCRFGGPHAYFGEIVEKPYIGTNERLFTINDLHTAIRVNNKTEVIMGMIICLIVALNLIPL